MKTFNGNEVPQGVLGVLYICDFNPQTKEIEVLNEIFYNTPKEAFEAFSNTPNPESHVAFGNNREDFLDDLEKTNNSLRDPKYLEYLGESI